MAEDAADPPPLTRLLIAHAGVAAPRHSLIWALDARLADIVRTTTEPLIGQMRLTWWLEVLTDAEGRKGKGDPLVNALRQGGGDLSMLLPLIDGWERLLESELDEAGLRGFAVERGGGLFCALAGERSSSLETAGAIWALWDLSGHVSDAAIAARSVELAKRMIPDAAGLQWRKTWKVQRIAYGLARQDIMRGRGAPSSLTPGLYGRFLRMILIGR
jgi:phytoene synthase